MQISIAASLALKIYIFFLCSFFLSLFIYFLPCNVQYIILVRVIKLRAKMNETEVILKQIKVENEKQREKKKLLLRTAGWS